MTKITKLQGPGIAFLLVAFTIWGLAPLYWKQLSMVPAFDIILFRVIWSLVCISPFFIWIRLSSSKSVSIARLFNLRLLPWMFLPALLLGANWLIYVWAVNNQHILESSLGYYINPLVSVLLGAVFLKEKLSRFQKIAVFLAAFGVIFYMVAVKVPPWIALSLAFLFGFYGLLRKTSPLGAVDGFWVEMILLAILAMPLIVYRKTFSPVSTGWDINVYLLLAGTGPLTALPMVTFTLGARRVPLHTVGFMQYIAPSSTFLIGLFYYREPFPWPLMVTFCLIWSALIIFSWDLVKNSYTKQRAAAIDKRRLP